MRTQSSDIFLGRQPIIDRPRQIVAYELLFRSSANQAEACVIDPAGATAAVITDVSIRCNDAIVPRRRHKRGDQRLAVFSGAARKNRAVDLMQSPLKSETPL